MPATFTVSNLNDFGTGSLRQAILDSNLQPGSDVIQFNVSGNLNLVSDLPSITDTVDINALVDGAPSFGVDAAGNAGLIFDAGSKGSSLAGIAIYGASGSGVTLNDSQIHVYSNYIGLALNGTAVRSNAGDGIRINSTSGNNLIGNSNPLSGENYFETSGISLPVSGWQGIRAADAANTYLITGTTNTSGLLYNGPIDGVDGVSYTVNYPGATETSLYGPDNQGNGNLQLVGTFQNGDGNVYGFLYQGTVDEFANVANYRQIQYPGAKYTYMHSVAGAFMVGNADGPEGDFPVGAGQAIIFSTQSGKPTANIVYPGSLSNTAYGIWDNGNGVFTIAGGYSLPGDTAISHGYIVDYTQSTGAFSNWKNIDYKSAGSGRNFLTHIQGISSVEEGVYTISVDAGDGGPDQSVLGAWGSIRREADGSFGVPQWVELNYPNLDPSTNITSSDSVYGNQVVGIIISDTGLIPYQASLDFEFQLSNVISNNLGNGIGVYGSSLNQIAMNYVGTDLAGTTGIGNGLNGILITQGGSGNIIGGQATAGNDPTGGVIARPPLGNLISGNNLNGVLINDASTENLLSGNFIGTDESGDVALGNRLDGVAIENANKNGLIGCTFNQSPFVFYNVISGNGANGLRIKDSNDITVHANFLGAGASNAVMVPNGANGILVEGTSKNTQVGGVIPLGNVCSGNTLNGIEVRDQVTGFVTFNTFAGLYAFGAAAPNGQDGILVTSTGGNNLIRTNVASGNIGNGIHISGDATGVTVDPNIAGLSTSGQAVLANGMNGILIDGNAHLNIIGGENQSVIPRNTFSGNNIAGMSFQGTAHDNIVFNTIAGLNSSGDAPLGNLGSGIVLGIGTYRNVIGGAGSLLPNYIGGNTGSGILIEGSNDNIIRNTRFGTGPATGYAPNKGNGILIVNGSGNQIGQNGLPNTIVNEVSNGVLIESGSKNQIVGNSIFNNKLEGIFIAKGANNDQPAPELREAFIPNPNRLVITGLINASPNSTYLIQIYGNQAYRSAPEGETFLGSVNVTTDSLGVGHFTYSQALQSGQGLVYTATATDRDGNSSKFSNGVVLAESKIYAVGAGPGGSPLINIYNALSNKFVRSIMAYDSGFTGGVRVALGDVTGDGVPEIIASPGPGGGPNIRVFDSMTGNMLPGPLGSFMAFSTGFTGGVFTAVGDVNEDGQAEIICGAGAGGGPNVRVFNATNASLLRSFYAFDPGFTGGVSVACNDVGYSPAMDIICGAGAGGGPNVRIYEGNSNILLRSFFAFDPGFTGGVFVAGGDVDGDGFANVIVGAGPGGGPEVVVYNGENFNFTKAGTFLAYDSGFTGGVRVGTASTTVAEKVNIITGPGMGGGPEVRIFDGTTYQALDDFFAFDKEFLGGIFVGGFEPFFQSVR